MKLLKIKAQGFKSFADKIELNIDDGITGVVGPNGSGKSNIVDAVKWVLGEQSVKALRGDSSMTDVIFSGSKSREAAKRCYVSLIFDNKDHYLSSEFEEIEIKRVLYKTGENDYFINNTKVRLKDVTNLFLDSGASKESFNIISQGNVKDIVNSKEEDRRIIFESAAGVLTYKKRKEETNRKIEKTKDNIEKIDLVIDELSLTLNPLKEEADKAIKYNELYNKLKKDEIGLLTHDIEALNNEYIKTKEQIELLNDKIVKYQATSSTSTAKLENLKLKQIKIDEEISSLNENINKLITRLSDLKSEKKIALEREKYEFNNDAVNKNLIELKENKLKLENNISINNNSLNTLKNKQRELIQQYEKIKEKDYSNNKIINELNNKISSLNKDIEYSFNKIDIMTSNIENNSTLPLSVKTILNNKTLKGIHNTIGNLIECDSIYTNAINVALSSSANFIVVDDIKNAKIAIDFLKQNKAGRATFFPLNIIKRKYLDYEINNIIKECPGFIGVASSLVKYDSLYKNIIENQLGNIIVVDTLDNARNICKKINYKARVVTLDGEIIHQGGSLTGGSLRKNNSVLTEKQDLIKEKNNNKKLQEILNDNKIQVEQYIKVKEECTNNLNISDSELIKINTKISQQELYIKELTENLEDICSEIDGITSINDNNNDNYLEKIMKEYYEVEKEIKIKNEELENLKDNKNNIVLEINEYEKNLSKENSDYFKLQQSLKQNEIDISKCEFKLDTALNTLSSEYSLTYEKAKNDYFLDNDEDIVRKNVKDYRTKIRNLGNVNISSIDEYKRINERYTFLTDQKTDLLNSISSLENIIREMDEVMIDKISTTFDKIRIEFQKTFKGMFKGGNGDLVLTNPHDILNTGIEIIAEPPGKLYLPDYYQHE